MIGRMVVAVGAVLLLAGCGGGSGSASVGAAATSKAPAETLRQVCPQVERALDPYEFGPVKQSEIHRFQLDVLHLQSHADLEASNALRLLVQANGQALAVYSDGQTLLPGAEAAGDVLDGIDAFAKRCKAAGSSALQ